MFLTTTRNYLTTLAAHAAALAATIPTIRVILSQIAFIYFISFYGTGYAAPLEPSNTDLWDVSQGSVVTGTSGVLNSGGAIFQSDIRNMFGYFRNGINEPESTIFVDSHLKGYVHWVEWQTPVPVTVRSLFLMASHDSSPRDANQRGFSKFSVYAFNDNASAFELMFEMEPGNPYGDTVLPLGAFDNHQHPAQLQFGVNIAPVSASRFRAEFTQFGDSISHARGPRVMELDAFSTTIIPEPSTWALIGTMIIGLFGWAFKAKRMPC